MAEVTLVGGHGAADPGGVVADLGVDSRIVPLGAAITPGHHSLQLIVAHHGAARVTLIAHRWKGQNVRGHVEPFDALGNRGEDFRWYLAGVLASLDESSTEHVGGDLSRVGRPAAAVTQDGGIQAHHAIRVVALRERWRADVSVSAPTMHFECFAALTACATDFQWRWCCPIQRSGSGCQSWHSWRAGTRCRRSCSGRRACSA